MVATVRKMDPSIKGGKVGRQPKEPDTSTYSGRIAARLRELRVKLGKSVEEMAQSLGMHPVALYRYEGGMRKIDPDLYPQLAEAFGLTVRQFLPKE